MGNLFYYRDFDHQLGDCSKARWRHAQKLLPMLVDFVNDSMLTEWADGQIQSVSVSADGAVSPSPHPPVLPRPVDGPFVLDSLLLDSSEADTIYVNDAAELMRLFAWCDFLEQRHGVFAFYKPLVDALRDWTRGIEAFGIDRPP